MTDDKNKEEIILYENDAVKIIMKKDFLKNPDRYGPGEGIQQRYIT